MNFSRVEVAHGESIFFVFSDSARRRFYLDDSTPLNHVPRMVETANNGRRTGPALEAMYQFMVWLVPTVEKFPRSQKFVLGDRIQDAALDVLDSLIAATYTRSRDAMLARANLGLERLRYFMRLSRDTGSR